MKTGIKKPVNPFPEFLVDEASGEVVINQRWQDWGRCHEEMMGYFKEAIQNAMDKLSEATK